MAPLDELKLGSERLVAGGSLAVQLSVEVECLGGVFSDCSPEFGYASKGDLCVVEQHFTLLVVLVDFRTREVGG